MAQEYCDKRTGWNQSPINIPSEVVEVDKDLPNLILNHGNELDLKVVYRDHDLSVTNQNILGYTPRPDTTNMHFFLEQDFTAAESNFNIKFQDGKLAEWGDSPDLRLDQFHIHEPSEHTINGHSYPLEMHLVHLDYSLKEGRCKDECTQDEHECKGCISKEQDGVAVFSMLFEIGEENEFLKEICMYLDSADTQQKIQNKENLRKQFNVSLYEKLIPDGAFDTYYSYEGSTTTPPCLYAHWFISQKIQTVTLEQIEILKRDLTHTRNNRNLQPLKGRKIKTPVRPSNDYYNAAYEKGKMDGLRKRGNGCPLGSLNCPCHDGGACISGLACLPIEGDYKVCQNHEHSMLRSTVGISAALLVTVFLNFFIAAYLMGQQTSEGKTTLDIENNNKAGYTKVNEQKVKEEKDVKTNVNIHTEKTE